MPIVIDLPAESRFSGADLQPLGIDQGAEVNPACVGVDGWACPHCGSALRSENETPRRGPAAR